jgi:quercetin dioxygenase-like cupin family protein
MVRRVVTGTNADGRSVVVSDEQVPRKFLDAMPEFGQYDLWGVDGDYKLPSDGTKPDYVTVFPETRGFRVSVTQIQPDHWPMPQDADWGAIAQQMEELYPGMASHMDPDAPGMHRTSTVDVVLVMDGEVSLELDDGNEAHLKAGDFLIQNGTRHAWRNRSDRVATIFVVMYGAA